jgi:cell division protein FtsB
MRGMSILLAVALAGLVAPECRAQKYKDETLHRYLIEEFGKLNDKLDKLSERVTAVETQVNQLKQQQAIISETAKDTQNFVKTTDGSLTSLRLNTQNDLLGLKSDVAQVRQVMSSLADTIRQMNASPLPRESAAPVPQSAGLEGYVTKVDETGATISLGSSDGVRLGQQFSVYRSNIPGVEIGVVEIIQILDAHNSLAKIVFNKPNSPLQFSDMARAR